MFRMGYVAWAWGVRALQVVAALLKKRAEKDARDDFRCTPLHRAARSGHVKVIYVCAPRAI